MPLLAITASLLCTLLPAQPTPEHRTQVTGETGDRILAIVREAAREFDLDGAVLAARDGKVVAAIGIGTTTHDSTGQPIVPSTLFEIASATKQFTAAAILHLQQSGKLSLDDRIADHLPGIPEDCRAITIRHLLQHTSGIPRTNSQGAGDDLAAVIPTFLAGGPRHEPGTHHEYWNQGYALLSEIVARASGMPYTDYCKEHLFEPAGMAATRFTGDDAPAGVAVATGRSSMGPPRTALEHPYGAYGFQYRGMGGAVTNVWDLYRWHRALDTDDILTAESRAQLFEPGPGQYALGWYAFTNDRGQRVQSHGGAVRGFTCDIRRYPDQDGFIAVLTSNDRVQPWLITQRIEDALFHDVAPPDALPPELIDSLAGTYKTTDRDAKLTIRREGGMIRCEILWYPGGPTSRMNLLLNDEGFPVCADSGAAYPIEIIQQENERATTISITIGSPITFERTD